MQEIGLARPNNPLVGVVPKGDFKRAKGFDGLCELIERKGGDPARIFAQFGIDPRLIQDEEAYFPYSTMARLVEHSAKLLDAPFLGLELAIGQQADVIGPLSVLLLAAPNIAQGLELVARYMAIHSPGARLNITQENGVASISYEVIEPNSRLSRQICEFSVATVYKTMLAIVGEDFHLAGVDFASQPPPCPAGPVRKYFGVRPNYLRPVSAIYFDAHYLRRNIDTGNPLLLRFVSAQCDALVRQNESLAERVAVQIRRLLPMGGCSLQMVARQLSLHPRSLQNRLTAEGLEFRDIMRNQRQGLARAYLSETRTPIAEVALLLGYSDQATFTRAFTSWQGMSPRRFRDLACRDDSADGAARLADALAA